MYNPYPLLLPDYENTEMRSPYWLVSGKKLRGVLSLLALDYDTIFLFYNGMYDTLFFMYLCMGFSQNTYVEDTSGYIVGTYIISN